MVVVDQKTVTFSCSCAYDDMRQSVDVDKMKRKTLVTEEVQVIVTYKCNIRFDYNLDSCYWHFKKITKYQMSQIFFFLILKNNSTIISLEIPIRRILKEQYLVTQKKKILGYSKEEQELLLKTVRYRIHITSC